MLKIKLFAFVLMISVARFLRLFLKAQIFPNLSDFLISLIVMYKCQASFYVIFFIEYNNFLLFSLNQHLNKLQCNFKPFTLDQNIWGLIHLFRNIQKVYFQMHNIALMINSTFGWFLLTILLDEFNIITNNIFTILLYDDTKFGFSIIRKF